MRNKSILFVFVVTRFELSSIIKPTFSNEPTKMHLLTNSRFMWRQLYIYIYIVERYWMSLESIGCRNSVISTLLRLISSTQWTFRKKFGKLGDRASRSNNMIKVYHASRNLHVFYFVRISLNSCNLHNGIIYYVSLNHTYKLYYQ